MEMIYYFITNYISYKSNNTRHYTSNNLIVSYIFDNCRFVYSRWNGEKTIWESFK